MACVGPAGVDVILDGLEALPANGELAHASRSEVAPGGACNVAIACSRLGLRSALVAPVCQDDLGSLLTARLAGAGVDWIGPPGQRTPVSVALGVLTDGLYAVTAGTLARWLRQRRRFLRYASGSVFVGLGVSAALAKRA